MRKELLYTLRALARGSYFAVPQVGLPRSRAHEDLRFAKIELSLALFGECEFHHLGWGD